jgi:hypothetical protein
MDKTEQIERLKTHIQALNKGYDNIIEILNEDVEKKPEKEGEEEKIAIKDDKIKVYAEGLLKSAETADAFLTKIQVKETELENLINPKEPTTVEKQDGVDVVTKNKKGLNEHLK